MRYVILALAILLCVLAHAQSAPPETSGVATSHAGQNLQVRSVVTSADSGQRAVQVSSNARVCLNGSSCTVYMTHATATGNITFQGANTSASSVNATANMNWGGWIQGNPAALPTCSGGTEGRIYLVAATPDKLCICLEVYAATYTWLNILAPGALGSSSTNCPDTSAPLL